MSDSLAQATGANNAQSFSNRQLRLGPPGGQIRELFESQIDRPAESQTSILQALAMMNGDLIQSASDAGKNRTLAAVLEADFFTDAERIETLFLATLSRPPRNDELERMSAYVSARSSRQPADDAARAAAFGDVFRALVNNSEFMVNH